MECGRDVWNYRKRKWIVVCLRKSFIALSAQLLDKCSENIFSYSIKYIK